MHVISYPLILKSNTSISVTNTQLHLADNIVHLHIFDSRCTAPW